MTSLHQATTDPVEEELSEDEEEMADDGRHNKLMAAMSKLSGKGRGKSELRSEPGAVSEFGLPTMGEGVVNVKNLLNSLEKNKDKTALKNQLSRIISQKKTLDVPLYSHEAEKIQRTVAYSKVSKDIGKWDQVVKANRKVEHMSFPLNQAKIGIQSVEDFSQRFKPTTPLEEEIYKLLNGNKFAETKEKELTRAEEEVLSAMSLEEAQIRRAELQKSRALQSYYEAKCKRQKRIKSKKYHRIKRKGKAKEEAKRMEEMMKTDPEAAEEELVKMEKIRAEERMNLRHKNTGKWAKGMMRFGKYSVEARQKIADQLDQNRTLTQKIAEVAAKEEEGDGVIDSSKAISLSLSDINNPWFTGGAKRQDEEGFIDVTDTPELEEVYSRPEAVKAKIGDNIREKAEAPSQEKDELEGELERLQSRRDMRTRNEQGVKMSERTLNDASSDDEDKEQDHNEVEDLVAEEEKEQERKDREEDEKEKLQDDRDEVALEVGLIDEGMTRKQREEDFEPIGMMDEFLSDPVEAVGHVEEDSKKTEMEKKRDGKKLTKESINVDPQKVFTLKPKNVISAAPDLVVEGDGLQESDHIMNIQEAFEDDDVVDAFKAEKEELIEKGKPKPVDLTLPGWGSWGGIGVKTSRKRKRLVRPAPPPAPRKDDGLHHVIINEDRERKISLHQVRDLPYPFASVEQFQKSIRAPVGNTWNTPSAVTKLTKPKYSTKMGTIIEPIQEEVLKKGTTKKRNRPKADIALDEPKSKKVKGKRRKTKPTKQATAK